jgi:putative SOS response-associated peptidase YedK
MGRSEESREAITVCDRYQRRSDKQKIAEAFHLGNIDGLSLELTPDYNVAPEDDSAVQLRGTSTKVSPDGE